MCIFADQTKTVFQHEQCEYNVLHNVLQKQDAYTHPQLPQITSAHATLKADTFYVLQNPLALLDRKFFRRLGYRNVTDVSHLSLLPSKHRYRVLLSSNNIDVVFSFN